MIKICTLRSGMNVGFANFTIEKTWLGLPATSANCIVLCDPVYAYFNTGVLPCISYLKQLAISVKCKCACLCLFLFAQRSSSFGKFETFRHARQAKPEENGAAVVRLANVFSFSSLMTSISIIILIYITP